MLPDVRWYVCDLVTGLVLTELPLDGGGTVKKLTAKVEQNAFTLAPLDDHCPDDWANLLIDGKTMIVLTLNQVPTQAWVVIDHVRGDVTVPITGSTLEECLQRTFVEDLDATMDDAFAAAELVAPVASGFGFEVEATACGKSSDHLYSALEDRRVLDAVNALMKAPGGPEWRIALDWADNTRRAFTKTIEIGARVGIDRPDAIFDLDASGRGVVESYRCNTSYAEGKGANALIGTSEGSGSSRPMTEEMVSDLVTDGGWPKWQGRVNFTGLEDAADEDSELNDRTRDMLAKRQHGTSTWTVTGTDAAPRPGIDFTEGDTVHLDIAPQGKLDPIGGKSAPRTQGWELNLLSGVVTVLLLEDEGDTDG